MEACLRGRRCYRLLSVAVSAILGVRLHSSVKCCRSTKRKGMRCAARCVRSRSQAGVTRVTSHPPLQTHCLCRFRFGFIVLLFFHHQVSLSFNETEPLLPQDPVALTVRAEPGSYVGVLAVDRSVTLLRSGNDISKQQVTPPHSTTKNHSLK